MMEYQITPQWRIVLDQDYERRVENQQLVLWKTGRTVLAVAFRYTAPGQRETLLQELKKRAEENKMDVFESQTAELIRFATLEPEDIGDGHLRLALHAFTASESACLQTAFYFDIPADLAWAIQAWESIQFTPPTEA